MPVVKYKGVTTLRTYAFIFGPGNPNTIPTALQDVNGNPIFTHGTYNGETVVWVNDDGSQARGVAGPQPADANANLANVDNVYNAYATPSEWEKQ